MTCICNSLEMKTLALFLRAGYNRAVYTTYAFYRLVSFHENQWTRWNGASAFHTVPLSSRL